jgi:hypothetical protein
MDTRPKPASALRKSGARGCFQPEEEMPFFPEIGWGPEPGRDNREIQNEDELMPPIYPCPSFLMLYTSSGSSDPLGYPQKPVISLLVCLCVYIRTLDEGGGWRTIDHVPR